MLIGAGLADGKSIIKGIEMSGDVSATVSCLKEMGAKIEIEGTTATVWGMDISKIKENITLNCNESGSTLRFLIPLSLIFSSIASFGGSDRLLERPQSVYEELFGEKGCYLKREKKTLVAGGKLESGVYKLRGDVSSQFLTGLLFL